ncbi:unnamed protein product [Lepidochelys olivacea]
MESMPVPIFIHMDATEYSLPCSQREMHVTNPTYRWAQDRRESQLLSVSAQGALTFRHFQGGSSGNYSCTISYKEHRHPRAQTFHYKVMAYHVRGGLEALLIFRSRLCQEALKRRLLWSLQEALDRVASAQHCRLVLSKSSCFPTLQEPWDEFNLQVSPFGPEWDKLCDPYNQTMVINCYRAAVRNNLLQAKLAMTRFLEEHGTFPITGAGAPRAIFNNRFTSFLKTERCAGGYGLSLQLETCPDCCILCLPGTFSAPQTNECTACPIGTFNPLYGRAACSRCKAGLVTRATGATSAGDCVEEEGTLFQPAGVSHCGSSDSGSLSRSGSRSWFSSSSCHHSAAPASLSLGCYWCHRGRQKGRKPPQACGGTAVTATTAHAPKAPYAASPPNAAAAANETVSLACSPSAGAGLEDTPRGPYTTGTPYTAAPASKTVSLASSPSAGAGLEDTPRGPYTTGTPYTAAPASKTVSLASSPSAGAGLEDTPRGPYTTGTPYTAAPASKTVSLASSPSAGAGLEDTPRGPYTTGTPYTAAPASKTVSLASSPSAGAGLEDTPRGPYTTGTPYTAAPASKTVSLASSPSAGAGLEDTPRGPYTTGTPYTAAPASKIISLASSPSAGAGLEDTPRGPYTTGTPYTAAPASKIISLASSPSAGAGLEDTPRAPNTAGAPGAAAASETLPLGARASAGASMEDLPPAPSPAEELSDREFVFPSPPVFSPASSNGNTRRPS